MKKPKLNITVEKLGDLRDKLKLLTLVSNEFSKQKKKASQMDEWVRVFPDKHKVIIGRVDNEIVAWGSYEHDMWIKKACMVGIYVKKDYREYGFGLKIGRKLFSHIKKKGYERVLMSMWNH